MDNQLDLVVIFLSLDHKKGTSLLPHAVACLASDALPKSSKCKVN
jgi:hypothetical protein